MPSASGRAGTDQHPLQLTVFSVTEPSAATRVNAGPGASRRIWSSPVAGWGSGAFGRAFYEHIEQARTTVSHSEPITVAAEQGAIEQYNKIIKLCDGVDYVTQDLAITNLADEEEHRREPELEVEGHEPPPRRRQPDDSLREEG